MNLIFPLREIDFILILFFLGVDRKVEWQNHRIFTTINR